LQKDYFQDEPLGEEYPCPELLQKDYYRDVEYLELELLERQVLLVLQGVLPLQA
jgi:hypothetical protein